MPNVRKFSFYALVTALCLPVACSVSGEVALMNLVTLPESSPIVSYDWSDRRHHRAGGGFQNVWGPYAEPTALQAAGWILTRSWRVEDFQPTAFQETDPAGLVRPYAKLRATWLGHASVLIQSGGKTILTDPIFEQRASPLSFAGPERYVGVPLALDRLPALDVVVISHNHYDHLNEATIATLAKTYNPVFLVPLGLGALLRQWGAKNVFELDWWQFIEIAGHRFSATPVQHFSSRSMTDRNATLWTGWFIEELKRGTKIYFGGDTGYGPFFRETRERLGAPDLALLPIGAYMPRWFMQIVHVDPAQSLQAFRDLEAGTMLPIHWGTYDLADEALDAPIRQLREAAGRDARGILLDLPVGGSYQL